MVAALSWALSVPVSRYALTAIRHDLSREAPAAGLAYRERQVALCGLCVSLVAGFAALVAVHYALYDVVAFGEVNGSSIAAGLLLFPIGTGLYYLTGQSYSGRAEVAAQFVRVKPLFAILLAYFLLREPMLAHSKLAVLLIILAIIFYALTAYYSPDHSWGSLAFGLVTAAAWGLGDYFLARTVDGGQSITSTLGALAWGAAAMAVVGAFPLRHVWPGIKVHLMAPFALHGVLSFALGYACFAQSLQSIGLTQTVLITAFWPSLGMATVSWTAPLARRIERRVNGTADEQSSSELPGNSMTIVLAAVMLLAASLVELIGELSMKP